MTLSVVPGDIDEQNHVNNTVYLRWVQEVATAHWEAIASSDAQEGIGWVVLRHEIDYKTPACLGDDVVLRTWWVKRPGLRSNGSLKSEGAAMASYYHPREPYRCPINAQTGRPVRVPAEVREQFSI